MNELCQHNENNKSEYKSHTVRRCFVSLLAQAQSSAKPTLSSCFSHQLGKQYKSAAISKALQHQEKSKRTLHHLVTSIDLIKLNKVDSEDDLLNLS